MRLFSSPSSRLYAVVILLLFTTLTVLLGACTTNSNSSSFTSVPVTEVSSSPSTREVIVATLAPVFSPEPSQPVTKSQDLTLRIAGLSTEVHIPSRLNQSAPAQILLALHGMNGSGLAFIKMLESYADRYQMVLVAPTLEYNTNWKDINVVAKEDPQLSEELASLLDQLPGELDMKFNSKILLLGFSRGAQLSHRFAEFYPERVLAADIISAGSYSLPLTNETSFNPKTSQANQLIPFPFGVGDVSHYIGHPFNREAFSKIRFTISVGEMDNKTGEVPHAYDPYIGTNRLERARSFYNCLKQVGVQASITVYPNTGHEVSLEMRQQAFQYFENVLQSGNKKAA